MAISPMMKHYLQMKDKFKDCVLFYRLGDFYEMFFDDAVKCSKILDLTLTGKDCGLDERAPMCGIPYHASENYISKLIDAGEKVAICEQLSEPKKGEIVERDVVRVVTAGTVFEDNMLDEKKNNYIACVFSDGSGVGVSYADVTTGDFFTTEFFGVNSENELNDILVRIAPSEIICSSKAKAICDNLSATKLGALPNSSKYYDWAFEDEKAIANLKHQFSQTCLKIFEIATCPYCIASAGSLIEYLNETQKRALFHIDQIKKIVNNDYMILDVNTRRNLEITETIRDRKKRGSLLWLLDETKTSMGARNFRSWIDQPLKNEKEINARLNGVEEIMKNMIMRENLLQALSKITDIERICGKLAFGSMTPRDCKSLEIALSRVPKIKSALTDAKSYKLSKFFENIADFSDVENLISSSICDNPPMVAKDGGFIKEGYNAQLDEYRLAGTKGLSWIAEIEAKERESTGIKNLKVGFNRVYGYYIEVNKSQTHLVPLHYSRRQTVQNNERYITEDLKIVEEKILGAEENSIKLEIELFNQLKDTFKKIIPALQKLAKIISEIDCLCSFAISSIKHGYVKPKVSSKIDYINIIDGRHPVVEALMTNDMFVPNDTFLNSTTDKIMIITGPNMAGKSTYMRQVAVLTFMAHIGCFVPAKSAEFPITDRIFTRVGASDDLAFGQSTFMVEMSEVALILSNATKNSLIILDEIGRGTSTFDGLAIAWAVIEYISDKFEAKTLFATHYHELTELEGFLSGVKNYKISIKDINNSIVFLRKIVRGGANKSFGIEVASLAGLPSDVIERAKIISHNLEESDLNKHLSLEKINLMSPEQRQSNDKSVNEVMQIVRDLKIERLSPLDAFDTLANLISIAKRNK